MIFQQILSEILQKFEGERSVSAPYYILIGKQSGQSIQDVGLFSLHRYFGILPKLSKKYYDKEIKKFVNSGYLIVNEDSSYTFNKPQFPISMDLYFDSWHYRGKEHIFFKRLSLIVQTLSHKKEGAMNFIPIQKDEAIQAFVRQFLYKNGYPKSNLNKKIYEEIHQSFQNISDTVKNILINRLSGFNTPGITWGQMAQLERLEEMDVQLFYISGLQEWLNEIDEKKENYPLLSQIAEGVRYVQPISRSAYQTAVLFQRGYTIEQICMMRHIKQSTVEDHLVELAMNDRKFDIYQFISEEDAKLVQNTSKTLKTKRLKPLKEAIPQFSYFQLKLALARGES